jgi:dTDP-4-dehydrorhamnose 3,5-epimerase
MNFKPLKLEGAYTVEPQPLVDGRGFFARVFSVDEFVRIGFRQPIVQINHTRTALPGTIRGMHYQQPPFSEAKVVRCVHGKVFDVIVDLRAGSPTFLEWASAELSEERMEMMYVPQGFAHGFQTLVEGCELIYLHDERYSRESERGLRADDPELAIEWPLPITARSERDLAFPLIIRGDFPAVAL